MSREELLELSPSLLSFESFSKQQTLRLVTLTKSALSASAPGDQDDMPIVYWLTRVVKDSQTFRRYCWDSLISSPTRLLCNAHSPAFILDVPSKNTQPDGFSCDCYRCQNSWVLKLLHEEGFSSNAGESVGEGSPEYEIEAEFMRFRRSDKPSLHDLRLMQIMFAEEYTKLYPRAQFLLGKLYLEELEILDESVSSERRQIVRDYALEAFKKAAEILADDAGESAYQASRLLEVQEDDETTDAALEKFSLLKRSAHQGHREAVFEVGMWHLCSWSWIEPHFKLDVVLAVDYLKEAAEKGCLRAHAELMIIYRTGRGRIEINPTEELKYLVQGALQGSASCQYQLSKRLVKGKETIETTKSYCSWAERAAEQGHLMAGFELSLMYLNLADRFSAEPEGSGYWARGNDWLEKTAKRGLVNSQVRLGMNYAYGNYGYPRDVKSAMFWFNEAVKQGDPRAMYVQAVFLQQFKLGTEEQRLDLLEQASDQDCAPAQYFFARELILGGDEIGFDRGLRLMQEAAENKDADAAMFLAQNYLQMVSEYTAGEEVDADLALEFAMMACTWLENAIKWDPNNEAAREQLISLLGQLGPQYEQRKALDMLLFWKLGSSQLLED
eukprot:TRINITY_DN663_c0_g1_i1.p1 TRINITY_DN663_c0_g1~~TRINITY_DN663_c0_g1_i1.p1  ORF type:complete len:612 (-),score=119.96 TRINITY_DN663_c0_g1_i1:1398-3233(-)